MGNVLREQLVNLYSKTTMFNITNVTLCPQIFFLRSINCLVFIIEMGVFTVRYDLNL